MNTTHVFIILNRMKLMRFNCPYAAIERVGYHGSLSMNLSPNSICSHYLDSHSLTGFIGSSPIGIIEVSKYTYLTYSIIRRNDDGIATYRFYRLIRNRVLTQIVLPRRIRDRIDWESVPTYLVDAAVPTNINIQKRETRKRNQTKSKIWSGGGRLSYSGFHRQFFI